MENSDNRPGDPGSFHPQRRTTPRYSLVATAAVTDSSSGTQVSGRVTEISRKGCFVDALNTLPEGTTINIRISRDKGTLATQGRVIYVQGRIGMGVTFLETSDDQLRILDAWLAELQVLGPADLTP